MSKQTITGGDSGIIEVHGVKVSGDAYREGKQAFWDGRNRGDNPYKFECFHNSWLIGFNEADAFAAD